MKHKNFSLSYTFTARELELWHVLWQHAQSSVDKNSSDEPLSEYTIPLIDLQAGHDVLQRLLIHVQIENGFFGLLDSFRVVDGVFHYSYTQKFLAMLGDESFKAFVREQGLV